MASSTIKQHILLETNHFGLQELRFNFIDRDRIDLGAKVLYLHHLKERLDYQSFTILLNDTQKINEISIKLVDKEIKGVLVPINESILQYRPFEDFYE